MTNSTFRGKWKVLFDWLVTHGNEAHCEDLEGIKWFAGIIISGGIYRDTKYLQGDEFIRHCNLVGIPPDVMLYLLNETLKIKWGKN